MTLIFLTTLSFKKLNLINMSIHKIIFNILYMYVDFQPKIFLFLDTPCHGLRTPNEGINRKYLKNWADVADRICFGHT